MDPSTFDLFHHAQRILCRCPNPDCGEISRLSKIDIKSGKESKPTWLDEYEDNMDDYYEDMGEYERTKEDEKAKLTAKGRKQVAKDVKKIMKKSLLPNYQKIVNYDPYDIKVIGNPVDLVVFDGATKIKEKVKLSGAKSLTKKDVVKEVVLLSKKTSNPYLKKLHKSIDEVIQNKEYEWKTAEVLEGNIEFK
jgi:predicted Holliday junction resolvase-like endonuclease